MPGKALLIGIDKYDYTSDLSGCVKDVNNIKPLLERNDDKTKNFHCSIKTSDRYETTTNSVKKAIVRLFNDRSPLTLLYFSGHGMLTETGGYLACRDSKEYSNGIAMSEIIELANRAVGERRHDEVIIILDCCHSGELGNLANIQSGTMLLNEGVSILTASQAHQAAVEGRKGGVFTSIICDALRGGAADLLGKITVAGLYSYADQLLTPFEQRPTFKTHIWKMVSLRSCEPKIPLTTLQKIVDYFKQKEDDYELNPSFEPTSPSPSKENGKIFKHLQVYNQYGLVRPFGLPQEKDFMYFAAMQSTGCRLTFLGKFYWRLVKRGII